MTRQDPTTPWESVQLMAREREAIDLAQKYAAVDPFYEGEPVTDRERALMHLALRSYTHPVLTEQCIDTFNEAKRKDRR